MLKIQNLCVSMDDKRLLTDINMDVKYGKRVLISGHNGSGKSTLAATIAGMPQYVVTDGKIIFDGRDITHENTTTRALMGIFLGAQNVPEIPGLTWLSFLKHACTAHAHFRTGRDLSMAEFLEKMNAARTRLNIPQEWLNRDVNVGFSGGERKRMMLMRLIMTAPQFAILDEPDSGADPETQQLIADVMHEMPGTTFVFISHQPTFTQMVGPTDTVHMSHGTISV